MRLIVSSFAILAAVFYELSGGADFQPPEPPEPVARVETRPSPTSLPDLARPATRTPLAQSRERIAARRVADQVAEKPAAVETVPPAASESRGAAQVRSSLSQGLTLLPAADRNGSMQLVSLELGASGLRQAPPKADSAEETTAVPRTDPLPDTEKDLREVTGTRVNMRDGPGTIYPVVARLDIGHKVEILSDSGTGWLRLRILPEQQLGWISSSLISPADR
ncbi:SH3 domain-containing protein [Sedimentitalea sp. JM2-8]|uniref:SH3 domain-containing protein n=1 Tax=Sedimentitalea xiamensis TaxID=3050037 RepID=A0ABT7FAH9_9RHOB|nr:SH3 domain-containing protein [Sedimentitalea xiamensis]MDK3072116.1 SH3 domain-containing protein [Sedimentitalea xiamensis]